MGLCHADGQLPVPLLLVVCELLLRDFAEIHGSGAVGLGDGDDLLLEGQLQRVQELELALEGLLELGRAHALHGFGKLNGAKASLSVVVRNNGISGTCAQEEKNTSKTKIHTHMYIRI